MTKAFVFGIFLCICAEWSMGTLIEYNPTESNLELAKDQGFTNNGQVQEETQQKLKKLPPGRASSWRYGLPDGKDVIVSWFEKAAEKQSDQTTCRSIFSCIKDYPKKMFGYLEALGQRDLKKLGTFPTTPAPKEQLSTYSRISTKPIGQVSSKISAYILEYSDPYWKYQWNLQDYRTEDSPVMDLNVVPAHRMGYTGKGVTVAVVDKGVEHDNSDFKLNFDSDLSYDMCKDIPGSKPEGDSHGTNCAGVIAMNPNNDVCGVGIAYDAKIVGLRAICPDQSRSAIAKAMRHHIDEIDIYTNSWTLGRDGSYIFDRDPSFDEAVYQGVTKGRGGKGVIYIHSSGNDKGIDDNCAVDPEINTPYVITIAAADKFGRTTSYSERCTAIMATTYAKDNSTRESREGIVAPDMGGNCNTNISETSSVCPQAAGIIALALEANTTLTYRDVMHLITMSAEVAPLADNKAATWYKNGRGFWVSNDFGFGLMNAENMVTLAKNWTNVPEKRECIKTINLDTPETFQRGQDAALEVDFPACKGTSDEINYIEHIELASVVKLNYRGYLKVAIRSPAGTSSLLLESRKGDNDPIGLTGWAITSTHFWGESPQGKWIVSFKYSVIGKRDEKGEVHSFTLKIHGTKDKPAHYKTTREYAAFRLPDRRTN